MNGDGPFGVSRPEIERTCKMKIEKRIEERKKIRAKIAEADPRETNFLLISEILDDYLEHRIEADKVLVEILKDIQGNIASIAEMNRSILTENTN